MEELDLLKLSSSLNSRERSEEETNILEDAEAAEAEADEAVVDDEDEDEADEEEEATEVVF